MNFVSKEPLRNNPPKITFLGILCNCDCYYNEYINHLMAYCGYEEIKKKKEKK